MTEKDFNIKYKDYIEEGFDGLEFDIPVVTEMLDKKFEDLIKIENFQIAQIKLKFHKARVYVMPRTINTDAIEEEINILVSLHDWAVEKGWWFEDGAWHNGEIKMSTTDLLATQARRLHR